MPVQHTFAPGQDFSTDQPVLEAAIDKPVPGTEYTFQLVVVDELGHESQPVTVKVTLRDLPVAAIAPPKPSVVGKPIILDASGSGPQGQIKSYHWKLVTATPAKK